MTPATVLIVPLKRPDLNNTDRFLFVWLFRWFPSVLGAIAIVRPETIIRWHRAGFRAYWRWRSRNPVGRPKVSAALRTLIYEMSRANALWGAPRIHGELLKLGFEVAQSTVAQYIQERLYASAMKGSVHAQIFLTRQFQKSDETKAEIHVRLDALMKDVENKKREFTEMEAGWIYDAKIVLGMALRPGPRKKYRSRAKKHPIDAIIEAVYRDPHQESAERDLAHLQALLKDLMDKNREPTELEKKQIQALCSFLGTDLKTVYFNMKAAEKRGVKQTNKARSFRRFEASDERKPEIRARLQAILKVLNDENREPTESEAAQIDRAWALLGIEEQNYTRAKQDPRRKGTPPGT